MVNRYQKHDVAHTFAFSERDFFCRSLFTCLFSLLRVKTFDADDVNNKVEQVCKFYVGNSTISRLNKHAKTCFNMLQTYHSVAECKPDKIISACGFRCLKFLVCYILIFDLCVLAFKKYV